MKLLEALETLKRSAASGGAALPVYLVSGFEPLHLKTFLGAHLALRHPARPVTIATGRYDDVVGNLGRAASAGPEAAAVVLEWSDLDPRLSVRRLGGWSPSDLPTILTAAALQFQRLGDGIDRLALTTPVSVAPPTLPLPPVAFTPQGLAGEFELGLRDLALRFASACAVRPNVRVLSPQSLDERSPLADRFDIKAELSFGFPYRLSHASVLADLLAGSLFPVPSKKGLISDLDDTLWSGILGEVGSANVTWDLAGGGQVHGLYQQTLRSLADTGVLIAVASKNDPVLVQEAFLRRDLLLTADRVFPIEAHWGPKSESVARILRAWNIGADSVVFVDDSPLELAEVKHAFPDIEGVLFPRRDPASAYGLLHRLRATFGRETIHEEDRLRLNSLRQAQVMRAAADDPGTDSEAFLRELGAEVTLSFAKSPPDPRALELVNKTNQFNLNGRRHTDAAWQARLADPEAFLLVVSYSDKFGPLGKVAVLSGRVRGPEVELDVWVMSCRAFARRIEQQSLRHLLAKFGATAIIFDFEGTPRNGPVQECLSGLLGRSPEGGCRLSEAAFRVACPPLSHIVHEI